MPGAWQVGLLKPASGRELYEASVPFLDWLLAYEDAVLARFGSAYRDENYLSYRKVPKAKQWVEPAAALQWFRGLRDSPGEVKRPKFYIQGAHA